ncbi:hypothetical protein SO694_0018007 [Aureococcus anophagefferens]|uniref:RRM domain-containing protein n=1 Tax=Aureococcus anophagefferens TaxID=44056 RepID=A0ABR1FGE8_AURAN
MSSGASAASVFTRQPVPGSVLSGHLSHLPLCCQLRLKDMVQTGALGPADLDPKLIIDLCNMPEESALVCVERFLNSNLFQIRNKSGFMVGVISRFKQEAGRGGMRNRGDGPKANVAGHGDPAKTIYVGKLGGCVAADVLAEIFGCIGPVSDARVDGSGAFAFVEFRDAEAAEAAAAMDGTDIAGQRIAVRPAKAKELDASTIERVAALHEAADALQRELPSTITAGLGVVGPTQLTALASITSPAALAALRRGGDERGKAPPITSDARCTEMNPAQRRAEVEARHRGQMLGTAWGMCKRRSESRSSSSRSRSRSPPRPNVQTGRRDRGGYGGGGHRDDRPVRGGYDHLDRRLRRAIGDRPRDLRRASNRRRRAPATTTAATTARDDRGPYATTGAYRDDAAPTATTAAPTATTAAAATAATTAAAATAATTAAAATAATTGGGGGATTRATGAATSRPPEPARYERAGR